MKRMVLALACSLTFIAISADAATNTVCSNINSLIHKQYDRYEHFQRVNRDARSGVREAKANIESEHKIILVQERKVEKLINELAKEEQRLAMTQKHLAHEKRRVEVAMQNKEVVSTDLIKDEQTLITALHNKYRNMCLIRNDADPAQTSLVQVFYP